MSTNIERAYPFVYGRPMRPNEFIGREDELRTIFNRLRNGESTAIVGAPRIGKSSILLKLADENTQQSYLHQDARKMVFSFLDMHGVHKEYTPRQFWIDALEVLEELANYKTQPQNLNAPEFITFSIKNTFLRIRRAKLRQILITYFNESELHDLCFDLGIEHENLAGTSKNDRARELIKYCQRHDHLEELARRCFQLRRHASWHETAFDPMPQLLFKYLTDANQNGYNHRSLRRLFSYLGGQGQQLVLLIDEFESLLDHPNFLDSNFFSLLRTLPTRQGGLAVVCAVRLTIAEMNRRVRWSFSGRGSPPFNNMIEKRLDPFSNWAAEKFLEHIGYNFSIRERQFMYRVTGRHPFLLQTLSAALIETTEDQPLIKAASRFYKNILFYFDDLWSILDNHMRIALFILSAGELERQVLGSHAIADEMKSIPSLDYKLRRLEMLKLAQRINNDWPFDRNNLMNWENEPWTVTAQVFVWWLYEAFILGTQVSSSFEQWHSNDPYYPMLVKEQWQLLIDTLHNVSQSATNGVADLAQIFFDELTRTRD